MIDDIHRSSNEPTATMLNAINQFEREQEQFPNRVSSQVAQTLKSFDSWMRTQNMTHNTIRAYKSRIKGFLIFYEFISKERELSEAECLSLYLNHLRKLQLVSRSISSFLTAYDAYSMFVRGTVSRITRPTRQGINNKSAVPLDPLFDHLNEKGSAKVKAIVHLITFEGLSASECVSLDLNDIVFHEGSVSILLGTKRKSSVVLTRRSEMAVLSWLDERLQMHSADPALFISKHGRRISSGGIDFLIRACGHKVFMDISAKTLRNVRLMDEHDVQSLFKTTNSRLEFAPETVAENSPVQVH